MPVNRHLPESASYCAVCPAAWDDMNTPAAMPSVNVEARTDLKRFIVEVSVLMLTRRRYWTLVRWSAAIVADDADQGVDEDQQPATPQLRALPQAQRRRTACATRAA